MPNPLVTYYQPHIQLIPGSGITINIDTGTEDEGDNEVTISATGGGTSFTLGGVFKAPTEADDVLVWAATFACTVTAVKAWQDEGTGSVVNAFSGSLATPVLFMASDYTILAADTIEDGGTVQNAAVASGDKVYIRLASVAGTPNEVGIQLTLTRS